MKKSIILLIAFVTFLTACNKNDNYIFDETPNERIKKAVNEFDEKLHSEYGWIGELTNGAGKKFMFYFKFDGSNRVVMYSDFNSVTSSESKSSSYRIKALQQPTLLFDTYSYIHLIADPDDRISGGVRAQGQNTDFEFAYIPADNTHADTLNLLGIFKSNKLKLVRATKEVGESVLENGFLSARFNNLAKYPTYFKTINIGGVNVELRPNLETKELNFLFVNAGQNTTISTPYTMGVADILFTRPVTIGSATLDKFTNLNWNVADTTLTVSVNGTPQLINKAAAPAFVIANSPSAFFQWTVAIGWASSYTSYTINGVDDALDLVSIPGIQSLDYIPKAVNTGTLDYFRIFRGTDPAFGPAFTQPNLGTPGIGKLGLAGFVNPNNVIQSLGTATVNKVQTVGNIIGEAAGHYYIQTRTGTATQIAYDMVSASDGRKWITWEY